MRKLLHLFLFLSIATPLVAQGIMFGVTSKKRVVTTLYYGYGCAGTSTNTCTVGGSSGNSGGFLGAIPITTGANAAGYTVKACGKDFNGSFAGNFTCAVYDNAGSSSPVSGCTASSQVAEASGWTENTNFSGCTLAASTTYKLAFQVSVVGTNFELQDGSGSGFFVAATYPTFASGVTWSSQSVSRSHYVRVTVN